MTFITYYLKSIQLIHLQMYYVPIMCLIVWVLKMICPQGAYSLTEEMKYVLLKISTKQRCLN